MSDAGIEADLALRISALPPERRAAFEAMLRHRRSGALDRIEPGTLIPLSYAQQRLWVQHQLTPAACNFATAVRLRGRLEVTTLVASLRHLTRRHEILRTGYRLDDEDVVPVVDAVADLAVGLVDLSDVDLDLRPLLRAESRRPFDLATPPMMRATIFRLGSDDHMVLLVVHHIATDGWSNGVLSEEVSATYRDQTAGQPTSLTALPVQYGDYAAWQRRRLAGAELDDLTGFWEETLRHLPRLGLPEDLARCADPRGEAANTSVLLPTTLVSRMERLRRDEGGSLYMLVLAALVVVLRAVSGQRDLVVGALVAGRTRAELERLVGYFVNVVPMRFVLGDDDDFRALWHHVREQVMAAHAHQELPYERILDVARSTGWRDGEPPIRVVCVAHQAGAGLDLPGLSSEIVDVDLGTTQFDLVVEVRERSDGLQIAIQYDTDLFSATTVQVMAKHVRTVLERVTDQPDRTASDLLPAAAPVFPAQAQAQAPSATLHGLFEERAAWSPDAVALRTDDLQVSYKALNEWANRIARRLRRLGVRSESRVALLLPRSTNAVVAMLGVLKAGGSYVPLEPDLPARRMAEIWSDARPSCVVTLSALEDRLPNGAGPVLWLDTDDLATELSSDLALPVVGDNAAYVLYTSGSMGRPKGVVGLHLGAVNRVHWMRRVHPTFLDDVAVARTSLGFVDSVWETFGPLADGVPLVVPRSDDLTDPRRLVEVLARHRVTVLVGVPSLLAMLLDDVPTLHRRLPVLRRWIVSGETLPGGLARRFHGQMQGCTLLNLYGSTEVSADVAAAVVPSVAVGARASIGRPIDNLRILVLDSLLRGVPVLGPGEIYVCGHGIARGYLERAADTAESFLPVPDGAPGSRMFRTRDAARWCADGQLDHLGRTDDQVQVRGYRIEPVEVEQALTTHPKVRAAAVAAVTNEAGSTSLVGMVVGSDELDPTSLREFLSQCLPRHLVPDFLMRIDAVPLTRSGKVDRRALVGLYGQGDAGELREPPRGGAESLVAEVFAELLGGHAAMGRDDDFFSLGGHSVLAARVARELRDRTGLEVGLRDLLAEPTVAGLASRLAGRRPADNRGLPVLEPAPESAHRPFPLTDVQRAYYVGRDDDFALGAVSTHAYLEVSVDDLDLHRFERALNGVIERHPMLRASINREGDQQVLDDIPKYQCSVVDLRGRAEPEEQRLLLATREEMSHQVLPADRWPLFEVRLSILRDGSSRIHVSVDALVCDAFSFSLILSELGLRYRVPETTLPTLEVTFRDYVLAARAGRDSAEHAAALTYWRERLAGLPPGPELPYAAASESMGKPRFVRRSGRLPAELWSVLKARAGAAALTPSALLLAAYAETLTRWSATSHYSIMLTVFQREPLHPQIHQVVGDFTSLSILEVDHRSAGTFENRAEHLQRRLWADLDHGSVSGVEVMREWFARSGSTAGLITPVVFTSNLPLVDGLESGPNDALGEVIHGITQTPQVHLDHQVSEDRGDLIFNWDAVEGLFGAELLDDMMAAYQRLLRTLATDSSAWRRSSPVDLPDRQAQRRSEVNDTAVDLIDLCLHEVVRNSAMRRPKHVAVVDGDMRLTYEELVARSDGVTRRLHAAGVGRGDLVAIVSRKGWQQVTASLGVMASGAAFVPLDPDLPPARLRHLVERAEARVVLVQAELGELPVPGNVTCLPIEDEAAPGTSQELKTWEARPDDLAYVIFTSGSTGEPKGVMIEHRGAWNTIACVNDRFAVGQADRVLAVSPFSFDLAIFDMFGPLAAGGTVVFPAHERRRDPAHWAELVAREGITLWNSVPALAQLLVEFTTALDPHALATLRVVLLSGDWIPVELPDRVRRAAPYAQVVSLGGATEASIWSVWHPIAAVDPTWTSIPYGVPMRNQLMYVLDSSLASRPDGVAGDLYIGGVGVARGYWRDPERTAQSFILHPGSGKRLYRTGDLARYRLDGVLEFLGREDDQTKVNGFRVELGEIEYALEQVSDVSGAAVVAVGDSRGSRRLVGFVTSSVGADVVLGAARAHLAASLPQYLVPATLHVIEEIPLTANGKVHRSELARRAEAERAASTPRQVVPVVQRQLEAQVASLWGEVLGIESVDLDDGFFALGGTSIQAVRLLTQVGQATGVRVELAQMLAAPTVRAMVAAIAEAPGGAPARGEVPVLRPAPLERHDPFPLTDIQQAYWLGRRATTRLGGVATHGYVELDIDDLDVDRLERALRRLVTRHDALRTVVRAQGDQQVLAAVPDYVVRRRDLRKLDYQEASRELCLARDEMSHQTKDPSVWPLFELRTHRIDQLRTRLHLSIDLLVADAHSARILSHELLALYVDPEAPLPDLGCTFRDYVYAITAFRASPTHDRAMRYWSERLPALPPAPDLPMTARTEAIADQRFERLTFHLPADEWSLVRAWAAATGVTPSAVVCAAFARVLGTWSASPRFTLNLTTFNRYPVHPDVDRLVGDFTTTTLLAVDASPSELSELARQIQDRTWRDLEHRAVSGVEVLRMLRRDRQRRGESLMPVVFTSMLFPDELDLGVAPTGWVARPVYAISQTSQVLLDHQVGEQDGRLVCTWDYVPKAFPPDLVSAMLAAFGTTLADLVVQARHQEGDQT